MSVEIREIIIKAQVRNSDRGSPQTASGQGGALDKESIIRECVRQVMQLLEDTKAR